MGEGIGARVCHVPIATKGGIFALLSALNNWDSSHSITSFCAIKPWNRPNFQIFKDSASQSINTNNISQKQMGEWWTYGHTLCCWSHCHYVLRIWNDHQHCHREDNSYYVTIGNIPLCTCMDFIKLPSIALGKKWNWVYCKYMYYEFNFHPSWNTSTTSSSTLQHIPITRSCDYLSLLVLLNTSSDPNTTFIVMFQIVSWWHLLFLIYFGCTQHCFK